MTADVSRTARAPNAQEMDHAKLDRGRRSGDDQVGKRDGALADDRETSQLASDLIAALGCREAIEVLRVRGEELSASAERSLHTDLSQSPVRAAAIEQIEHGADELTLAIGQRDAVGDVDVRRGQRGR